MLIKNFYSNLDCEHLIRRMLQVDPVRRIKIPDIKKQKWICKGEINCGSSNNFLFLSNPNSLQPIASEVTNQISPFYEQVLRLMASAGISREKTIEALQKEAYDHYVCLS